MAIESSIKANLPPDAGGRALVVILTGGAFLEMSPLYLMVGRRKLLL